MEEMIQKFVEVCSGCGYGYGYGSGYGSGYGCGYGYGYGDGDGYGYGDGYGDGYGSGDGYEDGSGYGDGSGSGSGDGYGDGYGSGYGLFGAVLNSHKIYNIDDVATIIYRVFKNYAKGAIVNRDLTLTPCFIAKYQNVFAHGETLHKAQEALNQKLLQNMPIEERINVFQDKFKPRVSYPIRAFYEWHNTLTGSCEMGRNQFAKEHCIDFEGTMTVKEFILLTENAYGGEVIKKLKPYYLEEDKP